MAISYIGRVICLIGVSLVLLHSAMEFLLWMGAPTILRLVHLLTARQRERVLYVVQLLPLLFAVLFTAALSVPQYIANETNPASERVGWLCLVLAAALYGWWAFRIVSGARIVLRTAQFSRACRLGARDIVARREQPAIVMAEETGARIALVGLIRPFIFISRSLMEQGGLDSLALDVVFEHERSHATQRDNWKLLALYCLPHHSLKVAGGKTWRQLWQSSAEWAADEDAVQGNSARALVLAETLVALARSRSTAGARIACTYFACAESELAQRVDRLIHRPPQQGPPPAWKPWLAFCCAAVAAAIFFVSLTSLLSDVPERLLHLG